MNKIIQEIVDSIDFIEPNGFFEGKIQIKAQRNNIVIVYMTYVEDYQRVKEYITPHLRFGGALQGIDFPDDDNCINLLDSGGPNIKVKLTEKDNVIYLTPEDGIEYGRICVVDDDLNDFCWGCVFSLNQSPNKEVDGYAKNI